MIVNDHERFQLKPENPFVINAKQNHFTLAH